jgi:hypothetical protein
MSDLGGVVVVDGRWSIEGQDHIDDSSNKKKRFTNEKPPRPVQSAQ